MHLPFKKNLNTKYGTVIHIQYQIDISLNSKI
jgi:hypothetical protein